MLHISFAEMTAFEALSKSSKQLKGQIVRNIWHSSAEKWEEKDSERESRNIYVWQPRLFCYFLQGVSKQSIWASLKWRCKLPSLCFPPCPPVFFSALFFFLMSSPHVPSPLTLPAKEKAARIANPYGICSFSYCAPLAFAQNPGPKPVTTPGDSFHALPWARDQAE